MADSTEKRLQRLEDRAAIADLLAHYGPRADSGNADGVARLWTPDGIYAVGGYGEASGHSAIGDLIRSPTHQGLMQSGCAHILSSPAIELAGDQATARNYSVVYRSDGDSFTAWRVSANRWALIRTDAGWRVARRDNAPLNGEAAARALLQP